MDNKCINVDSKLNRRTLFVTEENVSSNNNVPYTKNRKICTQCVEKWNGHAASDCVECKVWDDEVTIKTIKELPGFPDDLPAQVKIIKPLLKPGDKVYVMKQSLLHPWVEATIIQLPASETGEYFTILFDDGKEEVKDYKHLAYINASLHSQYTVGRRVIAKSQDSDIQLTDKFYVGVIAETSNLRSQHRYLIFFDGGCTRYVYHSNIRLVCGQSPRVEDDVHENLREFIKIYLEKFPHWPRTEFNTGQIVHTELNNIWGRAKVINIDGSSVQLEFLDTKKKHTEWMDRGSNRLGLILTDVNKLLNRSNIKLENLTENDKTINIADSDNPRNTQENSGVIKSTEIPASCPVPRLYIYHKCNKRCMIWVEYDYSQTKDMNVLSITLHYGFIRCIKTVRGTKLKKVTYTTPCGLDISDEGRMYNYLKMTRCGNSQMTIDLFNFDCMVDPLSSFSVPEKCIRIKDISHGIEFKTISVVNSLNALVPKHITYIKDRKTTTDINLNTDSNFLSGCYCIDDCEDKKICSCWKLTNESINYFKDRDNIGYSFKRLHHQVFTGIYECNANCKCKKTCLNRVVQEPLKTSLQLFLTVNKGWGVRTLADIPKGSFVCTFLGKVRTDKDTENDFPFNWGEFTAELDFIKTAEKEKDDYESDVVQSEDESEYYTSSSDNEELSDDASYDPSWTPPNKMIKMVVSKMSLRKKRLQDTNAKDDGKHELSKLNTQQKDKSEHKSLRSYLDNVQYTLDPKVSGNIGRYLNHSCDPNIFVQNIFVDSHDPRAPWVAFFAVSNIPAGTELAWDYNYTVGCVKDKKIDCNCGAENCKGRLL